MKSEIQFNQTEWGGRNGVLQTVQDMIQAKRQWFKDNIPDLVGSTPHLVGSASNLVGSTPHLVGSASDLVDSALDLVDSALDLVDSALDLVETGLGLIDSALGLIDSAQGRVGSALDLELEFSGLTTGCVIALFFSSLDSECNFE